MGGAAPPARLRNQNIQTSTAASSRRTPQSAGYTRPRTVLALTRANARPSNGWCVSAPWRSLPAYSPSCGTAQATELRTITGRHSVSRCRRDPSNAGDTLARPARWEHGSVSPGDVFRFAKPRRRRKREEPNHQGTCGRVACPLVVWLSGFLSLACRVAKWRKPGSGLVPVVTARQTPSRLRADRRTASRTPSGVE